MLDQKNLEENLLGYREGTIACRGSFCREQKDIVLLNNG